MMGDYFFMGKYNINFEIDIPYKSEKSDICMEKLKEILNKYLGQKNDKDMMLSIKYELEKLYYENPEYEDILIKNKDYSTTEYWSIQKIVDEYIKIHPERTHELKTEYTRIDINNMLFDLELNGELIGYRSPAICADLPSYNNQIYNDDVEVNIPIIKFGDKTKHEQSKRKKYKKYYD